jgi:5-methylcytosine-specific restriction endonuclease McrA
MNHAILLIALYALSTGVEARIDRSSVERHGFVKQQACPSTGQHRLPCPGWQIDHVVPLKCLGADKPENMQWLTVQDHKEKTKREIRECRN